MLALWNAHMLHPRYTYTKSVYFSFTYQYTTLFLVGFSIWHQVTELPFFASKVRLGRDGAEEILPLGPLNDFERYPSYTLSRLIMWFHCVKIVR